MLVRFQPPGPCAREAQMVEHRYGTPGEVVRFHSRANVVVTGDQKHRTVSTEGEMCISVPH